MRMQKKLLQLIIGFVVFYYLLHIVYDLPNLLNGNPTFVWIPLRPAYLLLRICDLFLCGLFTIAPYLMLYYLYPKGKILTLIICIGLSMPLLFLLLYKFNLSFGNYLRMRNFFFGNLLYVVTYTVFGIVFYFVRYSQFRALQQKELELNNRQSELSFLRAQINPHFLFNSLNNIYTLVYMKSDQALNAIAGFSELLRYMLYDTSDQVPLEKEVHYITQYIALQKLRFEHSIKADITVTGDPGTVQIAPLLLIPFIENAFKHGVFSENADGLIATLYITDRKIYFHCVNKVSAHEKDAGGGIGLENIKRRLALLYPDKYVLSIGEDDANFTVNLEIVL